MVGILREKKLDHINYRYEKEGYRNYLSHKRVHIKELYKGYFCIAIMEDEMKDICNGW